jgi:hypothetical protein
MLTRIESDNVDGQIKIPEYWLYKLHPAIRNYLESRMAKNLEREYGGAFSGIPINLPSNMCASYNMGEFYLSLSRYILCD